MVNVHTNRFLVLEYETYYTPLDVFQFKFKQISLQQPYYCSYQNQN